jgi:hypothetical protein
MVSKQPLSPAEHQRMAQDLVHVLHRHHFHLAGDHLGDVLEVLFVFLGNNHLADSAPVGGQHFFLQAADGQHPTAQGDLAGHGHIPPHRSAGQRGYQRGAHGDAGRRAVFGDGAFGNVDVQIQFFVKILVDAQIVGTGADEADRRLGRFFHHVSQFAGDIELALTRHGQGFHAQQFAAHLGPGQPGGQADLVFFLDLTDLEGRRPQHTW